MPDFIIFITFICAFQGIITGVILLFSKRVRVRKNLFLVLFLLAFSFFLLAKNLYWGDFYVNNPHFIFLGVPLTLLMGPFLYLYMAPRQKGILFVLHFIPFLLLIANHIPFYTSTAAEKVTFLRSFILSGKTNTAFFLFRILIIAQITTYVILNYRIIAKGGDEKKLKWFKTLNLLYAFFGLIYLMQVVVYGLFNSIRSINDYFAILLTIMAVFVLVFVTKILLAPELFKWSRKYAKSNLTPDRKKEFAQRVTRIMNEDRPYLNQDVRLIDLAHKANLTEHVVSQVLNDSFGMNFFEFINSHRIERAKELLLDNGYMHYTIDAISQEVGFKSKSSFYEAFKRFAGTTPNNFKKEHL